MKVVPPSSPQEVEAPNLFRIFSKSKIVVDMTTPKRLGSAPTLSKYSGISSAVVSCPQRNATFKAARHVQVKKKEPDARKLAHATFVDEQHKLLKGFEELTMKLRNDMPHPPVSNKDSSINEKQDSNNKEKTTKTSRRRRSRSGRRTLTDDEKDGKHATTRRRKKGSSNNKSSSTIPPKTDSSGSDKSSKQPPNSRHKAMRRCTSHGGLNIAELYSSNGKQDPMRRTQSLEYENDGEKKRRRSSSAKSLIKRVNSTTNSSRTTSPKRVADLEELYAQRRNQSRDEDKPRRRSSSASKALKRVDSSTASPKRVADLEELYAQRRHQDEKNGDNKPRKRSSSAKGLKRVDSTCSNSSALKKVDSDVRLRRHRWQATHSKRNVMEDEQDATKEEKDQSPDPSTKQPVRTTDISLAASSDHKANSGGGESVSTKTAHKPRRRRSLGSSILCTGNATAGGARTRRCRRSSTVGNVQLRRALLDQEGRQSSIRDLEEAMKQEQQEALDTSRKSLPSLLMSSEHREGHCLEETSLCPDAAGNPNHDDVALASLERRSNLSRRSLCYHQRSTSLRSLLVDQDVATAGNHPEDDSLTSLERRSNLSRRSLNYHQRSTSLRSLLPTGAEDGGDNDNDDDPTRGVETGSSLLHASTSSSRRSKRDSAADSGSLLHASMSSRRSKRDSAAEDNKFDSLVQAALNESFNSSCSSTASSVVSTASCSFVFPMVRQPRSSLVSNKEDGKSNGNKALHSYLYGSNGGGFDDLTDFDEVTFDK
ncbi:expressed unknown protein [Seminavis robusta]|uniref:Uncharacterized protein n=1 Tax=Seminavis robusta TaxID=568900 RepID=A0A9N8EPL0_9STRA|nr:expressed unknown protein [Seminavis robusta]|eukprot:Sro1497_g277640.1 n/a (766) ;mRNA; f:23522-25819